MVKDGLNVLVHCHVGSLENLIKHGLMRLSVHCHVGSLESIT